MILKGRVSTITTGTYKMNSPCMDYEIGISAKNGCMHKNIYSIMVLLTGIDSARSTEGRECL